MESAGKSELTVVSTLFPVSSSGRTKGSEAMKEPKFGENVKSTKSTHGPRVALILLSKWSPISLLPLPSHVLCLDTHSSSRTEELPASGIAIATMSLLPGKAGNPAVLCAENAKEGTPLPMLSLAPHCTCVLSHTEPLLKDITMKPLKQIKGLTPGNSQLVKIRRGKPLFIKGLLIIDS